MHLENQIVAKGSMEGADGLDASYRPIVRAFFHD